MSPRSSHPVAALLFVGVSGVLVSGCLGPTYGTDKTVGEQLMDDLGNAVSLRPRREGPPINYSPRPAIVTPANTAVLPPPQENIAEAAGAEWPESPEQRRQRVLQGIEDGNRDPNFIVNPQQAAAVGASEGPGRVAGTASRRVFLTDPPVEYLQPADTAAYGDLGPTEAQKERAAKRAQGEQTGIRRWLPWL